MKNFSKYINELFQTDFLPGLTKYLTIPNLSPDFDPSWETNGFAQQACDHIVFWIKSQDLQNCEIEVIKDPGKTHLILCEIQASVLDNSHKTALIYGHWDKQPPLENRWEPGLSPFKPVIRGSLLYGRGSADDGYSGFAAILAIKACQKLKIAYPRTILLFESCEESGKDDLTEYLNSLIKTKLSKIDYVICLDSTAIDPYRLWINTSMRGIISFDLTVRILESSVHSGDAGGIVPETFRIMRILLDRIEKNGKLLDLLHVKIPESRIKEAEKVSSIFGKIVYEKFPWIEGAKPEAADNTDILIRGSWYPALAITGAEGLPKIIDAGNVLRSYTQLKLSIRTPPTLDSKKAFHEISNILLKDPPYNSQITIKNIDACNGWAANEFPEKFKESLDLISKQVFGQEFGTVGVGASVPFMAPLGEKFPNAIFIATGACSMTSNDHGPNENLDLDYTEKLIQALSLILEAFTK